MDFMREIEDALTRTEIGLELLREDENSWSADPASDLVAYCPTVSLVRMKKHAYDFIREVWHLGDGARELFNQHWAADKSRFPKGVSCDHGRGPGKVLVANHVRSCKWVQLASDLANLSKHYRLTQATKSGGLPPQFGQQGYTLQTSGRMEFGTDLPAGTVMRVERPAPVRPVLTVLDASGAAIGEVVDIGIRARDSWLVLLNQYGFTFTRQPAAPAPPVPASPAVPLQPPADVIS
jgi:hypothetical protein